MLTRGNIIGKVVDDLATLKMQVSTRNKLQQFDLTKFCEDFFKDLLNIIYKGNLKNLNQERVNESGIDLGDKSSRIAYQITSTKTSKKVTDTLSAITEEHKGLYDRFKILIIGEKQTSYTIDETLLSKVNFNIDFDIIDIDDLLQDIVVLEVDSLDALLNLFNREFRQLRVEFEPVDKEGNYASSIYNNLEPIPNKKPVNAGKLSDIFEDDSPFDDSTISYKTIIELYRKLSLVPRVTREIIAVIAERGKYSSFNHSYNEFGVLPKSLQNILRMSKQELDTELSILRDAKIIYYGESYIEDDIHRFVTLSERTINEIILWASKSDYSLKTLINTMDWTVMDV